jgi:hypothetical protein
MTGHASCGVRGPLRILRGCTGRGPGMEATRGPKIARSRVCLEREREGTVKPFPTADPELGDQSFTDLIACERDCRTCSYAAWLDCDGDCGPCPHNAYCPCVNPVVARSKSALRILELRPQLLQEIRARS